MEYSHRLTRLRRSMAGRRIDAMLISQPENRRYLSGYSAPDHTIGESTGLLLIVRGQEPYLLTDFRFKEQAERETEATGFTVVIHSRGIMKLLEEMLPKLGVRRLGFESDYTLYSTAEKLFGLGSRREIDMVPLTGVVEAMRRIKSEAEIERILRSVALNEQVFRQSVARLQEMEDETDLALAIARTMRKQGAERESFDTIVAAGSSGSLPHAVPGKARLAEGTALLIDMGLILDGYCSDMTRSFVNGEPDAFYLQIHRLVRRAQLAGIAAVRAGVRACDVDRAARSVIEDGGYGDCFGHSLGHGVGLAVHEAPRVSAKNRSRLEEGMVITIEPGIYIPGWGGIRLEDMVVVRKEGCDNLNTDTSWLDL